MQKQDNKFLIGEFVFDTFHEYRDGQEDLKKIECINKELNIHDPEVAVRLYNMIRTGEILFKSPIGDQFYQHLADIVADKSVGLLEDKAVVDEAENKVKYQKVIGICCMGLAIIFFAYFGFSELQDYVTARKMHKLQEATKVESQKKQDSGNASSNETDDWQEDTVIKKEDLTILPEYKELYAQNPELVGWLEIPDTEVNYPVVQKAEDNEYYLTHSFDKKDDSNGTLFVDYRSDIVNPTTNTIIYGHNMKSGRMFGNLKYYLDEDFYAKHKTITFNTIYEKRTYEIIAVCLSKVEYQDDNNYRYYNFINATEQPDLEAFCTNVEGLSVYNEKLNLSRKDKLLTLSTCNSYTEDGRLFLVAKRVN